MSRKGTAILVIILAIIAIAVDYAIEFVQVDSCLDRGGAFDYGTRQCITDSNVTSSFEFVPYPVRNRGFLAIVGVSALSLFLGLSYVGNKSGA